jgi:hypothetical protein
VIEQNFRPLRNLERKLFERLFEKEFPGRTELNEQLVGLQAKIIDDDGSLALKVAVPIRAVVSQRVPIEGRYSDYDTQPGLGPFVNILLHVVDGLMVELEIYKDDGSPIERPLSPNDVEIT